MTMVTIKVRSEYLNRCARIRNITTTALVRQLVAAIEDDQLVLAILDDNSQHQRERYQHRYHDNETKTQRRALDT